MRKFKKLIKKLLNIKQNLKSLKRNYLMKQKSCTNIKKGYDFLLGRMYFTVDDGYQNLLVFTPMLSSLTLDNDKKVTYCISTRLSTEQNKINHFILTLNQPCLI